ncbi:lysophospholipid acyltransferase family protein [Sediminicoccus sp. KRV36]|uniref:lysophospholipid acyltransferase family protein n=1 Tax=Sediminicoccus sp. KRV36 TaxID=3133721 RepID=UPI00200CE97C|nr:lysophospholipid acyltransferase family protein [Sediminicoccus rosea]UPY37423.1 lysophospholipid acyltransferase family protein [Sediminicoccus rosea]
MLRRLTRHPAFKALAAKLLGLYLALVYRTTRWQLIGGAEIDAAFAAHGNVIAAFWHENLPVMPHLWRVGRARAGIPSAHVLVSRHRDGRFIGDIVTRFELNMVHASTSKGGAAGMLAMARLIRTGAMMVITPDGPRGPRREAAPGVAQLAALSGKPVLPCAGRLAFTIGLRSWDRMEIPLPFGRGVIVAGPAVSVARDAPEAALPAITAALDAACDAADAAIGRPRR